MSVAVLFLRQQQGQVDVQSQIGCPRVKISWGGKKKSKFHHIRKEKAQRKQSPVNLFIFKFWLEVTSLPFFVPPILSIVAWLLSPEVSRSNSVASQPVVRTRREPLTANGRCGALLLPHSPVRRSSPPKKNTSLFIDILLLVFTRNVSFWAFPQPSLFKLVLLPPSKTACVGIAQRERQRTFPAFKNVSCKEKNTNSEQSLMGSILFFTSFPPPINSSSSIFDAAICQGNMVSST